MNIPLAMKVECARGEVLNALESIIRQHGLPPCILDGILSSVLVEIRSETKMELVNATNQIIAEKNEELEKAKVEAKKVLEAELEEIEESESD